MERVSLAGYLRERDRTGVVGQSIALEQRNRLKSIYPKIVRPIYNDFLEFLFTRSCEDDGRIILPPPSIDCPTESVEKAETERSEEVLGRWLGIGLGGGKEGEVGVGRQRLLLQQQQLLLKMENPFDGFILRKHRRAVPIILEEAQEPYSVS